MLDYIDNVAFVCICMQLLLDSFANTCKYVNMKCEITYKENSEKLQTLFKALGDKNRFNIFKYLCRCSLAGTKENSVNDVKSCCDIDLSVVSRHLAALKNAGVLSAKKEGKNVFYSLNAKEIAKTLRELADSIENCCQETTETNQEES